MSGLVSAPGFMPRTTWTSDPIEGSVKLLMLVLVFTMTLCPASKALAAGSKINSQRSSPGNLRVREYEMYTTPTPDRPAWSETVRRALTPGMWAPIVPRPVADWYGTCPKPFLGRPARPPSVDYLER
jgi:hypothetical protein